MTVVAATFGALSEVQIMHTIYHFKAQEVNNPMLQTVCNSELKWRSYSHYKPITPSWRKHFAKCCEITLLLRSDFAAFLYSRVYFLLKLPNIYRVSYKDIAKSSNFYCFCWNCCIICIICSWICACICACISIIFFFKLLFHFFSCLPLNFYQPLFKCFFHMWEFIFHIWEFFSCSCKLLFYNY